MYIKNKSKDLKPIGKSVFGHKSISDVFASPRVQYGCY